MWVFGLVDTSHTPALGYMEIVSQRDAATLLPIIQAHVAPGTIIHSDQWAAYRISTITQCCFSFHRESLDHVCGSYYPHPHTECRVLLGSGQNKVLLFFLERKKMAVNHVKVEVLEGDFAQLSAMGLWLCSFNNQI